MPLDQSLSNGVENANHPSKLHKIFDTDCSIFDALKKFACSVPDFRRTNRGNIRHNLSDIIRLMILTRMSRCVSRADIIAFGKHNLNTLQSMGLLKKGVPSEPTLFRVESGIDNESFAENLTRLMEAFDSELLKCNGDMPEIICVDGKAMRGTVRENGRSPDIVSAYSYTTGITLATEACHEKSNEIKAMPLLIDKIDISGKLVTADAMSMQKDIIDKIRNNGGDFIIELKANQRALRYGVEDRINSCVPQFTYTEEPELAHGRIETRTYNVYAGLELIADKEKWGGNLTFIEFIAHTTKKSTGNLTTESRLYVSSLPVDTPWIGLAIRHHWSVESMHRSLDVNLCQDNIKRKSTKAARNLDTIQRLIYNIFSIWKGRRKKLTDKAKGVAELMRDISMSLTKLNRFLSQK